MDVEEGARGDGTVVKFCEEQVNSCEGLHATGNGACDRRSGF